MVQLIRVLESKGAKVFDAKTLSLFKETFIDIWGQIQPDDFKFQAPMESALDQLLGCFEGHSIAESKERLIISLVELIQATLKASE